MWPAWNRSPLLIGDFSRVRGGTGGGTPRTRVVISDVLERVWAVLSRLELAALIET